MSWISTHWETLLIVALFVLTEALPFLPTKYNGIAQFLLALGRRFVSLRRPSTALERLPPEERERLKRQAGDQAERAAEMGERIRQALADLNPPRDLLKE